MNKAILMGNLTADPELRTTGSGIAVVSFTLAIDRRFKNSRGERETDFIRCEAWRQTAEFISKWFNKGSKLAIVGTIQTGSYEKNGQTVYTTTVVADEAYFVESRRQDGGSGSSNSSYDSNDNNRQERQSYQDRGYQQRQDDRRDNDFTPAPSDDTSLPFDL